MDSVWNGAFETLYRRKAAELTASLTTDEGYGNGNKTLLTGVLKGEIDIEDLTSMNRMSFLRVLQTSHQGAGASEGHQTFAGVIFDYVYLSKCGSKKCTFTELQMRSADEGSTTFVTCVDCSYKWSLKDKG
jgi:DNA-directed RNA polymerase subunit M/transcription elongation factor TFIIS